MRSRLLIAHVHTTRVSVNIPASGRFADRSRSATCFLLGIVIMVSSNSVILDERERGRSERERERERGGEVRERERERGGGRSEREREREGGGEK